MMNFKFKLREQTTYCDPVGPSFMSAKKWKISIGGTVLAFMTPKHKPMIDSWKPFYPENIYEYETSNSIFRSFNNEIVTSDKWEYLNIFYHNWAFNGPWFSGCLANVTLSVSVLKFKDHPEGVSFFHPRAFEQAIADYLTVSYSKFRQDGKYKYTCPVAWEVINSKSVLTTRFQTTTNYMPYSTTEFVVSPIDSSHLIVFSFSPNRSANGTPEEIDKVIGYKNIGDLIDTIIDSIDITLSTEAKKQRDKALEGMDDTSLIDDFSPLKWSKPGVIASNDDLQVNIEKSP